MRTRALFDMDVKPIYDPADLARWSGGLWRNHITAHVHGFSIDTRSIRHGDLFIAIKGEKSDGHSYIADAVSHGATAVMIDDESCLNGLSIPALIVRDTKRALMELARGYRATLKCRMIAVTGSVGKTTVKELIASTLHHVGKTARTRGNWNNDLGMPLSILAAPSDAQFGVFEVGMNHPGELEPLCDVLKPDISVVTCVGPVHIEHFTSEDAIAVEKASVYRGLGDLGIAVVNLDDAHAKTLLVQAAGKHIVTVSSRSGADYYYKRLDPARGLFEVHDKSSGDVYEFIAALPGAYFVQDAALCVAVTRTLGVGWPVIRDAIQHYQPLAMRWNRHTYFGIHTVNDAYNANPVSIRAAIEAFMEEPVSGQRWLVLAGMLELGTDEESIHRDIGAFVARYPSLHLMTVGRRGTWIAEGAAAAGLPKASIIAAESAVDASRILFDQMAKGDAVLFKASRGEAVENVLREWKKLMEAHHEGPGG
jgi:UDP-N-acetylmuramoyl-tripeptide--D-alanyl-D-alanine ligase